MATTRGPRPFTRKPQRLLGRAPEPPRSGPVDNVEGSAQRVSPALDSTPRRPLAPRGRLGRGELVAGAG